MKKLSKKERKLKKKKAIEYKHVSKKHSVESKKTASYKTLTGMVVKKKYTFVPSFIDDDIISVASDNIEGACSNQIVFKPQAVKQLKHYIDWGRSTKRNTFEQQGILLGNVYQTPSGYVGVVDTILLSESVGNQVYIESAHSDWSKMDQQMDEINSNRKRKLVKLGWWHTHPNMGIFMSGTDRETQANYFYKDWQFAVVLNPQDEKWGAFAGEKACSCAGFFLNKNVYKLKSIDELADKITKKEETK